MAGSDSCAEPKELTQHPRILQDETSWQRRQSLLLVDWAYSRWGNDQEELMNRNAAQLLREAKAALDLGRDLPYGTEAGLLHCTGVPYGISVLTRSVESRRAIFQAPATFSRYMNCTSLRSW